jgi:hypothetical protein
MFSLRQVFLVGLGGDAEDEVANLELRGAKEGSRLGGDQSAGDLEELLLGGVGDALGQQTGPRLPGRR